MEFGIAWHLILGQQWIPLCSVFRNTNCMVIMVYECVELKVIVRRMVEAYNDVYQLVLRQKASQPAVLVVDLLLNHDVISPELCAAQRYWVSQR